MKSSIKAANARSKQSGKVSNIQKILYSILDDLDVHYYREHTDKQNDSETIVGPWSFDCVIPRKDKTTLLIECQGDYWHGRPKTAIKDKAKATYINKYFPKYEIKYLWEHEFNNKNRIIEVLKRWTFKSLGITEFNFIDINIKKCDAKEYKLLLSKYHYLASAERHGITYGAYFNSELIAVCSFSPLVRQNIGDNETTRELSRFCISPKYQKKNFGSWFISRCVKKLDKKYSKIISYCDTTYNHDGALYKACNFILDKKVKPDYWYVNNDGWVMHKKTLYNHAVKMKMKERDYATEYGYHKVWGKEKLRFVFERN